MYLQSTPITVFETAIPAIREGGGSFLLVPLESP